MLRAVREWLRARRTEWRRKSLPASRAQREMLIAAGWRAELVRDWTRRKAARRIRRLP